MWVACKAIGLIVPAGATAANACSVCQAGTYWTGSGLFSLPAAHSMKPMSTVLSCFSQQFNKVCNVCRSVLFHELHAVSGRHTLYRNRFVFDPPEYPQLLRSSHQGSAVHVHACRLRGNRTAASTCFHGLPTRCDPDLTCRCSQCQHLRFVSARDVRNRNRSSHQ